MDQHILSTIGVEHGMDSFSLFALEVDDGGDELLTLLNTFGNMG